MGNKIAFVVHRYGLEVNGGAEDHCRLLAEHLLEKYEVEVLTSKSRGMIPWDNNYINDREKLNGVNLLRFRVEDGSKFSPDSSEYAGPYCPTLIDYIRNNYKEYKVIIFFTYGYYPTNEGLKLDIDNAIFLPTAHDNYSFRTQRFGDVFSRANGFLYNTLEEKQLVEKYYSVAQIPSRVTCFGMNLEEYDIAKTGDVEEDNYILYMGRVSNSKNFKELNDYFLQYKKRNSSDLKLIVLGKVDNWMTIVKHDDIIFKGFVSEEEKKRYIKNAMITVLPSRYESLSIVVLESLAYKVPVLVSGHCPVLEGQCVRSNAGLWYTNYGEFERMLTLLINNPDLRKKMGENGRRFVENNYTWEKVVLNVTDLIEEVID